MKRSPAGLLIPVQENAPLRVGEIRLDWDMDYAAGTATEIISRGPAKEGDPIPEPIIVNMMIADILELAATVQLQSLAFMRERLKGAALHLAGKAES